MNDLLAAVKDNLIFVVEVLGIVAGIFAIACLLEKAAQKKNGRTEKLFTTRKIAMIGMFSAIAMVLMMFEVPVPFAPPFYKIDLSEIPVLICAFAFGPAAGVLTEFIKIVLELFFRSTTTAFVGELANFAVGCAFILPASAIYSFKKTRKTAIFAAAAGTVCMTVFGTAFNAIYLLPKFAVLYGMPLDALIAMGSEINGAIHNITTFVICAVAPLNLLKGVIVSTATILVYKKLSPVLKEGHIAAKEKKASVN